MQRLAIPADLDNLGQVRDFIEKGTHLAGIPEDRAGELLLAVDEAVTNIIMHGCPNGGCGIELEVDKVDGACVIRIRDDGPLFDPTAMHDPDLAVSPLERDTPGGFGVYLIRHLVDDASYQTTSDGRNELTLRKLQG